MAARAGSRLPARLRHTLIIAGMLLAGLVALQLTQNFGPRAVLLEQQVSLPDEPSSSPHTRGDDSRVRFSSAFVLPRDGALRIELDRSAMVGWVGVAGALVDLDRGTVREFTLDSDELPSGAPGRSERPSSVRIGALEAGHYRLRLDPGWQPLATPRPARHDDGVWPEPPRATVRVRRGLSLTWPLWLAVLLIAAPPAVSLWRWRRRSDAPAGATR
jgi:hypothetical protein